jgi:muramoyltetrapeptide carboxypeptidase
LQRSFPVEQVVYEKLKTANVPSFIGAMFGHISQSYLLPIGIMAEIDANKATITMLEAAVI